MADLLQEKARLASFDQVMQEISRIAGDPEHSDQFKALKLLAAQQATSVTLPSPEREDEACDRIARVMRCVGLRITQIAYHIAFPSAKAHIYDPPALQDTPLPGSAEERARAIRTVRALYRAFPEMKKPGFPAGFPAAKGALVQQDWCRREALKIFRDREQQAISENAKKTAEETHERAPEPTAPQQPAR